MYRENTIDLVKDKRPDISRRGSVPLQAKKLPVESTSRELRNFRDSRRSKWSSKKKSKKIPTMLNDDRFLQISDEERDGSDKVYFNLIRNFKLIL